MGAEPLPEGGTAFRVWAPLRKSASLVIEGIRERELEREDGGYFSGVIGEARAGDLYRYRLDGGDAYPDPASRFQPNGPHGPSQIVDPGVFRWSDSAWRGAPLEGQVIYEMHIGTFTHEGTWQSAERELPELARIGITVLEVMPVADFAGGFGWGYDGVNLFAPTRLYGRPDDFRRFVDKAHSLGLGVILDVVYNHAGPDGNYLGQFSPFYFTNKYETDWGNAINFDGENSGPVREFYTSNAVYWIAEYHLDGLRLDATQNIYDHSAGDCPSDVAEPALAFAGKRQTRREAAQAGTARLRSRAGAESTAGREHILAAISKAVRRAAGGRHTLLVAENETQNTALVRACENGGYGLDALWNDDLHHSARVAMTGRNTAYYMDYLGSPQEFVSAAKYGYLYQGQWYRWQEQVRGVPTFGLPPAVFVNFIDNHDQISNSGRGQRAHQLTSPGRYRAMTAYVLLCPGTPMLFQGQEFAASTPFLFFADHHDGLAPLVRKGRSEFLSQFPELALPEIAAVLADPCSRETFERCKLDLSERLEHAAVYRMHVDLLRLRREDPVFRQQGPIDGAVIGPEAFVLRFFGDGEDRLLLVNLGADLERIPAPEPLLAPPYEMEWEKMWSSEEPDYGGGGMPPVGAGPHWRIPGPSAVALKPRRGARRDFMPKKKERIHG